MKPYLPCTPTILGGIISLCLKFCLPAMAEGLSLGSVLQELYDFDVDDFDVDLKDALESASESIRDAVRSTSSIYRPSTGRRSLGPVSISLWDRWIIEAHGVQMTPPSRVQLSELSLDLLYPSMEMAVSLGDLHLDGAFHAQGPALGPAQGRFTIALADVKGRGHVGITMKEDSLLMSGFSLKYEPSDITINVTRSTGEVDVYPASAVAPDLAAQLMPRLSPLLDAQVKRTVGEALVEESISERLGDDRLAAAYLKHVERAEFLTSQVLARVLEQGPGAVPAGLYVLPEQRLESSEWVRTGPLSLRGVRLAAEGPVCVARVRAPGPSRQLLLFAKLQVRPFQLDADWSGSVGGPHAGGLDGQCGGGSAGVRLELGPGDPPRLQMRGVDLLEMSAPQVTLPSKPEHPLPLLLTGCVSTVLARSLAPALQEALAKGCSV